MLPKKFFLGVFLLTVLVIITGCATDGKTKDRTSIDRRIAGDECIRQGLRRDSYDYNRCIERKLELQKKNISPEHD